MRLSRMLSIAVTLVLAWTTGAAAAAMLRTAPFPGDAFGSADAASACYVTNTGTTAGMVSATLYDVSGGVLETLSPISLIPHATTKTAFHPAGTDSPAHCLCVVPSTLTYRCSFVYVDKGLNAVTVIGAP